VVAVGLSKDDEKVASRQEGDRIREMTASSRRSMLKRMGAAGVVTATGIGMADVVGARSANAATGNTLQAGDLHAATNMTYLQYGTGTPSIGGSLTTEPTLLWGDNRTSPLANANGIRGDGKGPAGMGLWGNSDYGGVGVYGGGGIGVQASGSRAALQLLPNGVAPRSRGDAHTRGEVVHDTNGDVWVCVNAGSPGTWRKIAGPSASGAFQVLGSPVRAYDSRTADGKLSGGGQRTITLTGVPSGSSAATVSLTVTGTTGSGFLAVFKEGVAYPGNSNLNWYAAGQTIAVTTVSAVSTLSRIIVRAGGGGSTHVIIDVIGYHG
jgi:hypothetical protein